MDISLLTILKSRTWDMAPNIARGYAEALHKAMVIHLPNNTVKKQGFFLSRKGTPNLQGGFEDKLYIGNIHRIENHLYWNDEELADDDQIVNVVVIDGPVTRDGGGCSYGSKDWRDQVMYANTIPQVVGHLFCINTPGGESACRNDYEMMINDCREKNKPTVAFVDGMCCSSGINLSSRCDRTIVMNAKDMVGCIGSMAAFWGTPDGAKDIDGSRYVEIVGTDSPDKNKEYRDASNGDYTQLQEEVDKDTKDFHQTVRDNRPLVTDDFLKGDTFDAQDAIPALVDEIGDMTRAIQCVFDLADGTLTPAREATSGTQQPAPTNEPDPNNNPPAATDPDEPEEPDPNTPDPDDPDDPDGEKKQEELGKLNDQQSQAASNEAKHEGTVVVDNGHVRTVRQGMFGSYENEIAKPNNQQHNNMTEEEKKNAQAEQTGAAQEQNQAPAQSEQNAEGAQKPSDESKEPANGEQQPANADEHKPADGEQKPQDGEQQAEGEQKPADADELTKVKDALHTAEGLVADRDKSIAEKDSLIADLQKQIDDKEKAHTDALADKDKAIADKDAVIADKDKSIAEKDALIAKLTKQVSDLQGEVKELAASPTPMTEGTESPKDNGAGAQPEQPKKYFKRGQTYEEIRAARKQKEADMKAKKEAEIKAKAK